MLSDRRGWEEDTSKGSGGSGALLLEDVTGLGMQISSPHGWNQVRGCTAAAVRHAAAAVVHNGALHGRPMSEL